ncbi:hypothetical protein [Burkholderia pseudomallei]|uniref:hypothetical protein n=1 Tax=Burkholderia pseudomallei TaxID=28450 RepID=UPI00168A6996|nr:hypothetical protein [Burkholderia pseudomallei]MBD2956681.1 hypothetical protein [Burkholderia pseudomallei]MBD2974896.1 hypothetical protein [Burkholderia pseudomallei]MBF3693467.1 hypothetical protein [Burkholderia pseudomallei]
MKAIDNSIGAPGVVATGAGALSPKFYQLPERICFFLHLRLDSDPHSEELRVVTWCPSALTKLLKAKDALSAEIHMLRPGDGRGDVPAFQRITEVHLSEGGKCVFRLETGEQFLSLGDQEPVAMVCLCHNVEDAG